MDTPIELETVVKKISADEYRTPEDFEYDVLLIFKNCEKFNIPKHNDHIVQLAKFCAKSFRKMYSTRMKSFEANGGKYTNLEDKKDKDKKRPPSQVLSSEIAQPTKKPKISLGTSSKSSKSSKSLKVNIPKAENVEPPSPPKSKSPKAVKPPKPAKSPKPAKPVSGKKNTTPKVQVQNDGPVPLHVAIAQIKESYPVRRPYKDLTSWEGACARFFRDLMRHPWLSAARPKFIFHVPVPILFPEIKEAYAAKISKPMDLTSIECMLLAGEYTNAQEFVDDLATVFSNAVKFNRAGHDEGEPMSCAYYDASRHLLKYTRWLSLDYLSSYLSKDSDNDGVKHQGPISEWKLTKSYAVDARGEMESTVFSQMIEKSEEGDRFTWMEAECEKLLKALRHQSDLKHMTFFIQPNYPADYKAFVSKPMDWEFVQRSLQQRKYNAFGDIVEDLRLIFSNAVKYNARAKGTDTVSGRAYDSALFMSAKLESAIDRMLTTVSDRIEREKIDQIISEREIEAAERAEEERIRTEWHKEREKSKSGNVEVKARVQPVVTVKLIQRRPANRDMDFEFPFYDEDDGHHEQSHMEALRQQKLIFEKQQRDRTEMRNITKALGFSVLSRLVNKSQAIALSKKIAEKNMKVENATKKKSEEASLEQSNGNNDTEKVSKSENSMTVSNSTDNKEKDKIKIVIPSKQKTKKKKNRVRRVAILS